MIAKWSMSLTIPHAGRMERIAMAMAYVLPDGSTEVTAGERRKCIGRLLEWMRSTHATHPELPEYAGKSYLPEPDNFTKDATDEQFATRGIKIVREVTLDPRWGGDD